MEKTTNQRTVRMTWEQAWYDDDLWADVRKGYAIARWDRSGEYYSDNIIYAPLPEFGTFENDETHYYFICKPIAEPMRYGLALLEYTKESNPASCPVIVTYI